MPAVLSATEPLSSQSSTRGGQLRRKREVLAQQPSLQEENEDGQRSKIRATIGRISAPREPNGRFVKVATSRKHVGKPLTMITSRDSLSNEAVEPFPGGVHQLSISSVIPPGEKHLTEEATSGKALTSPLPSELVNEIYIHSILPGIGWFIAHPYKLLASTYRM